MRQSMTVHAFGIAPIDGAPPLESLLAEIQAATLADRVRSIGDTNYRVETILQDESGLWLVDFGKFRDEHGPGAAALDTPIRGFEFEEDEVFCEETAFLYDPNSKHAVIQYNHYGARAGSIQEYFSLFSQDDTNIYEFMPKYDDDVNRRFLARKETKRLTFAIDPRFLSKADRQAGTALAQAIDIGDESNGTRIELTITAGREQSRFLSKFVDRTAVSLKKIFDQNPDAIQKLEVGILPSLESKMEILDLLAQRLLLRFHDIPVGTDLRFPQESRFKALRRAHNAWQSKLR